MPKVKRSLEKGLIFEDGRKKLKLIDLNPDLRNFLCIDGNVFHELPILKRH